MARPFAPIVTCTTEAERRARALLTWHAGDCGLISDRACDYLADMIIGGELSNHDLRRLAKPAIWPVVMRRVECLEALRFVCRIREGATAQGRGETPRSGRSRSGIS